MPRSRYRAAFCLAAGAVLAAASPLLRAFSSLIAFGDSLSDVGNVYSQTFNIAPQSPPYYQGRYSNGPLWIEDLAADQGMPVPTRSRSGGSDWAYAGTTTGGGSTSFFPFSFPNIGTQINNYLSGHAPAADQLFAVWGGGNDFMNGQTNPSVPVSNLSAHVTSLANAGAKTFIVPNLPLLGEIPKYRGTANEAVMNDRTAQFNTLLAATLNNLELSLNVQIYQLDVASFFNAALADPAAYGFANVTSPALVNNQPVANQDQYLFWDDVHPTRIGHSLLGGLASDLLDTHTWVGGAGTAAWGISSNWNPPATPQSRWIAVLNNPAASPRSAIVAANSTVRRLSASGGAAGAMAISIQSGATLTASEQATFASGAELNLAGGRFTTGSISIEAGANLSGAGTIAGNLTNGGTIRPGLAIGSIAIDGSFVQTPAGTLRIDVAGSSPADADRLSISGDAGLAGTIGIALAGGYIALPGTAWPILAFGSRSGDLDVQNLTGLPGLRFDKTWADHALTLTASALGGDANLDGHVDVVDLGLLATNWQCAGNWLAGDFTDDGLIDVVDLGILATHWQEAHPLSAALSAYGLPAVPEPASAALATLLLGLLARRGFCRALPISADP